MGADSLFPNSKGLSAAYDVKMSGVHAIVNLDAKDRKASEEHGRKDDWVYRNRSYGQGHDPQSDEGGFCASRL
ncbi:hypothetical protein SIN01_21540 [Sporolactobacillus inulinus]|nr:hypothetical protein SIN01_21540 [Sporolactobacillus inulinus]